MTLQDTGEASDGCLRPSASAGPVGTGVVVARTEGELVDAVREADESNMPVHVVGATRPVTDRFDGRMVRVASQGISVNDDGCSSDSLAFCGGVLVTVAAGEDWDDFVAMTVRNDWVGLECLAGVPGSVGGVTVHNVAAFGQSVADTVASVRTWDRGTATYRRFAMVDCEFGDGGESRFRRERMPDGSVRYVVLEVAFLFRQGDLTSPVRDEKLLELLSVRVGERVPLKVVRNAVLTAVTS